MIPSERLKPFACLDVKRGRLWTSHSTNSIPTLHGGLKEGGIELGRDDYRRSLIRVLDIGGMLWEGEDQYETIDEAMNDADALLARWREENGY